MCAIEVDGSVLPGRPSVLIGRTFVRRKVVLAAATLDDLYRRERPWLLRYLRKHAGLEEAEDLLQDVFVRAAASKHIAELRNPGGYLCRIAQTVMIDHARRRGCRISCLPLECAHEPSCDPRQEEALLATALEDELQRGLLALPRKTRWVFMLHRYHCLTYRQIHDRLGISEAAVEYHMVKALRYLRKVLAEA